MPDSRNWFPPVPAERRRRLTGSRREGAHIVLDGRRLVDFASNDYLGLTRDARVREAAMAALREEAAGSGGSRLISGDDPALHALERELADWKGFEAALVIGSGMLANIGLLQVLAGRGDELFADRLNHASLVDGARLAKAAGARVRRFPHRDMARLEALLAASSARRKLIVSDGVFSMDGDAADAAALRDLACRHDALLVLDDAHGAGVLGPEGRGLTALAGIAGDARLVEIGTFGKALGGYGAFVLGSREMIAGLRQRMRTLIYSTALPPSVIAANRAALALARRGEARRRLRENLALFRRLTTDLPFLPSETPIQPLMLGEDARALAMAAALREAGFFAPAIRPPTVPEGGARLRITISAAHEPAMIEALAAAIREALERL